MRCGVTTESRWATYGLPVALLAALVAAAAFQSPEQARSADEIFASPLAAGLTSFRPAGRDGSYEGIHPSRRSVGGERHLSIRTPSIIRTGALASAGKEITVSKSTAYQDIDFDAGRRQWKYLSKTLRRQIDEAWIRPGRWRSVMIHSSATERGNAKVFGYHHRHVKKLEHGLAYHFVIGNGTYSGDGEIEVGERWTRQDSGEARNADRTGGDAIEVCLVGDFENNAVRLAQLEAFDELTDYLQAKVGVIEMRTHSELEGAPTACPGRLFPKDLF